MLRRIACAISATLQALFARLIADLDLHPCGDGQWHQFPDSGGITGVDMLSESHLACHSFPEYGTLCLNLFCCRPRPDWDFAEQLRRSSARRRPRPPPRSAVRGIPIAVAASALQVAHTDD